eukprot:6212275-Pleurochrysis_carterae.AAC.5
MTYETQPQVCTHASMKLLRPPPSESNIDDVGDGHGSKHASSPQPLLRSVWPTHAQSRITARKTRLTVVSGSLSGKVFKHEITH